MTLRLRVNRTAWLRTVATAAAERPGLVPVVKGNGYGFGRTTLMPIAAGLGRQVAVGTVYEVADVPPQVAAVVLTPHLARLPDLPQGTILTVADPVHVDALAAQGWRGDVIVKLRSSMHRYGVTPDQLPALLAAVMDAGLGVDAVALHLPLSGAVTDHVGEIEQWLTHLDPAVAVSVSHLPPATYATLCADHTDVSFRFRCGTALWHADRPALQLRADVLAVTAVPPGCSVGYRGVSVPDAGHVVVIGAGSAHGLQPLPDGRSPFHFERQRMMLLESPHMHSSMAFAPADGPCPGLGDQVDVQFPLTRTLIDELDWIDD